MKTLLKKISSQAFSCITNQKFSSNDSNSSSIWGGNGVDINSPTRVNGLHNLWTNATNHPTSLIPQSTPNGPSAMRLSEDSLTSISTSIGHNSASVHEGLATPELILGNSDLDPLLFGRPEVFNALVEAHTKHFGTQFLNLPEASISDRIHNLHILQGTPANPNFFENPELLLNVLNSVNTSSPSPTTSSTSTPTSPVSMDQIDTDIQNHVTDGVIKVVEEVSRFF